MSCNPNPFNRQVTHAPTVDQLRSEIRILYAIIDEKNKVLRALTELDDNTRRALSAAEQTIAEL